MKQDFEGAKSSLRLKDRANASGAAAHLIIRTVGRGNSADEGGGGATSEARGHVEGFDRERDGNEARRWSERARHQPRCGKRPRARAPSFSPASRFPVCLASRKRGRSSTGRARS